MAENETNVVETETTETEQAAAAETEKKDSGNLEAEIARLKSDLAKSKAANDRLASENAEKKREIRERMSEQERAAAEREESEKAIREELESYRQKERLATSKAGFMSCGLPDGLAAKASESWVNGDLEGLVSNFAAFLAEHDKAMNANNLKGMTKPPVGGKSEISNLDISKMSYAERAKLYTENRDEYEELAKR